MTPYAAPPLSTRLDERTLSESSPLPAELPTFRLSPSDAGANFCVL
jgi:hypothetical protein